MYLVSLNNEIAPNTCRIPQMLLTIAAKKSHWLNLQETIQQDDTRSYHRIGYLIWLDERSEDRMKCEIIIQDLSC
ncbi:unnamed protein product [Allacma fusca]|uniref:Uncharacterized protein n=1 Tax=Allacma fusca TaxID=39272 RepID=A0A8J2PZX3_9HEXA|nr:unnamed protein product [Allacma fusca]